MTKLKIRALLPLSFLVFFVSFIPAKAANNQGSPVNTNDTVQTTDQENQVRNQVQNQGSSTQVTTQEKATKNNTAPDQRNMDKAQLRGRANKSRLQNMFEAMIQNRIQMVVRIETRLGQKNMVDSPDLAKIKDTLSSTKSGLEQLSKNVGQSTSTDPKVLKEEAQEQLGKFHGYSSMIIQGQGLILVATGKTIVTRVETALAKIEETSTNNPLPAETQTKIKTLKTDLNSLSESIDSAEKKITGITPAKNKEEAKNNLENTKTIIKNLRTEIAGIKDQLGLLIPELKTFIQTNKKTTKPVTGQEPSKTLPVNNPEESVAPTLEP